MNVVCDTRQRGGMQSVKKIYYKNLTLTLPETTSFYRNIFSIYKRIQFKTFNVVHLRPVRQQYS